MHDHALVCYYCASVSVCLSICFCLTVWLSVFVKDEKEEEETDRQREKVCVCFYFYHFVRLCFRLCVRLFVLARSFAVVRACVLCARASACVCTFWHVWKCEVLVLACIRAQMLVI